MPGGATLSQENLLAVAFSETSQPDGDSSIQPLPPPLGPQLLGENLEALPPWSL